MRIGLFIAPNSSLIDALVSSNEGYEPRFQECDTTLEKKDTVIRGLKYTGFTIYHTEILDNTGNIRIVYY